MGALYAPDVVFSDPVFPRLEGARAGAMWRMLTTSATDLAVEVADVRADDVTVRARWRARCTFW